MEYGKTLFVFFFFNVRHGPRRTVRNTRKRTHNNNNNNNARTRAFDVFFFSRLSSSGIINTRAHVCERVNIGALARNLYPIVVHDLYGLFWRFPSPPPPADVGGVGDEKTIISRVTDSNRRTSPLPPPSRPVATRFVSTIRR